MRKLLVVIKVHVKLRKQDIYLYMFTLDVLRINDYELRPMNANFPL